MQRDLVRVNLEFENSEADWVQKVLNKSLKNYEVRTKLR